MPQRHSTQKNLYEMYYQVRRKLSEISASYWTDLEIYSWLNEASQFIARKSKCLRKTVTITTVDGTQEYDLNDNSFQDIIDISDEGVYFYASGTTYIPLEYTTKVRLNEENSGWRNTSSGQPHKYYYDKATKIIGLYPKPNSTNAGAYLFVTGYFLPKILHAGTAAAGATTSLTLAAGSSTAPYPSTVNDYYNNIWMEIYSGTGAGEKAEITDYVGSTRVCTIDFTSTPSTDSVYGMIPEIPDSTHYLMELYALAKAYEKGGSRVTLASNYWKQFYDGLSYGITELEENDDEMIIRNSYRSD